MYRMYTVNSASSGLSWPGAGARMATAGSSACSFCDICLISRPGLFWLKGIHKQSSDLKRILLLECRLCIRGVAYFKLCTQLTD